MTNSELAIHILARVFSSKKRKKCSLDVSVRRENSNLFSLRTVWFSSTLSQELAKRHL